jgi:2,4-dichlorophenol 6-monooxygenase
MSTIEVPVLIIGGGGCGLSSSIFLSNLGVDHLLVERHSGTSNLPKAHYLNQRTMEVYRQHGVADRIYEVGASLENFGKIQWKTSLGGDRPIDGRLIHEMDAFGGGSTRQRYEIDGPSLSTNYPQLRLEPLLREEAEKRAPGQIQYSHEVTAWEHLEHGGVEATVLNRETNESHTVKARYVIAADGGKTIGPALNVEMTGPTSMVDMVSTHFSADLSEYVDDETLITWFLNPEGESSWGSGAMVKMGPTWDRHSEEWVVHFAFRPDDPERFNEDAIVPRLRELLKLPDLPLTVHKVSHWILDRIVAQQWRFGDIFLAGDAAHRQPPTTGLGLNTGIQDAHNLAWKLAAVLSGSAGDKLLDSYQSERLPLSTDGADWALLAFMNHTVIDAGIGLTPGAPVEANTAAFEALLSDTRIGRALRVRARDAIGTQRFEFHAHDVEIGLTYEHGALVPDGSGPAPRSDDGTVYTPTTQPGRRLPHAWLQGNGTTLSTQDLVGNQLKFALITGSEGEPWIQAAVEAAAATGIDIEPVAIGGPKGPVDKDGRWAEISQIEAGGAVLVRPDNHIAWRSHGPRKDSAAVLTEALTSVLGKLDN